MFAAENKHTSDATLKSFKVAKLYREKDTELIKSMDFTADGLSFINCCEDDRIEVYSLTDCELRVTLTGKKYGVDLIKFIHVPDNAIHASTKVDDTIRYLSLLDNKFIRYFPGHKKKVISMSVSPTEDIFISSSLDKTIRHWDLRVPACKGVMHMNSPRPIVAFDPLGIIFAAGLGDNTLKLYDIRNFDKGAFHTMPIPRENECQWTDIKFSPDGKMIMVLTNGTTIWLVDAFNGVLRQTLTGYANSSGVPIQATFTPDVKYILSGSTDGYVHTWNIEKGGRKMSALDGGHLTPNVLQIQFNPRYQMFASATSDLAFWIPYNADTQG